MEKLDTGKGRKFRRKLHVLPDKEDEICASERMPEHSGNDLRVHVSGNDGSNEEDEEDSVLNLNNNTDEWEHFSEFREKSDTSDSDWI